MHLTTELLIDMRIGEILRIYKSLAEHMITYRNIRIDIPDRNVDH